MKIKNKLRYLICFFIFLLLTACGGTVKTNMSFDSSFSGSRVMSYTLSNQDYNSSVNKDFATVKKSLKALCPEGMEISSISRDDSNITAVFTINFASLEDYKQKVSNILTASGVDITPEVMSKDYNFPNTIFAGERIYRENFSSQDLLHWIYNSVVENNYVTESYYPYIFSSSLVSLSIGGEEYAADTSMSIIDVNAAWYLPVNYVSFTTVFNRNGTVGRTIRLSIPDSSFDTAKDEIEKFMNSRVGDVGNANWAVEGNSHIFTVEGDSLSTAECKKMTDTFTGHSDDDSFIMSDDSLFNSVKSSTENTDIDVSNHKQHIFDKIYHISEHIDLKDYISNGDNAVNFKYNINPENTYSGTVTDAAADNKNVAVCPQSTDSTSELYNGYSSSYSINLNVSIAPHVSKYKHIVSITPRGNIKRDITVVYKDSFNADEVENLEEKLKSAYNKKRIRLDKIDLKKSEVELKISSAASVDEDNEMWRQAMGSGKGESILNIDKKEFLSIKQLIYFKDDFSPEIFTSGSIDSYEYIAKNVGKPLDENTVSLGDFKGATAGFNGNSYMVKGENISVYDYVCSEFKAVHTGNIWYITILFIFSALFFAFIIIVFFRKKSNAVIRKKTSDIDKSY